MSLKKIYALILIAFFSLLTFAQSKSENQNLLAAYQAQGSLKLEESNSLFKSVVSDSKTTNEEKCKALRALGIQEWKFYKNYDNAKHLLLQADSIGHYRSETWLKINRVERKAGKFDKALIAAKKSINLSEATIDKNYARYMYCKTVLEHAINQFINKVPYHSKELFEASNILNELLLLNPTNVNAAEVLLGISILLKNGKMAYKSWLAYFRFNNTESAYKYLKESAKTLHLLLPKWKNNNLSGQEVVKIIEALGQSRFYNYAKIMAIQLKDNNKLHINKSTEIEQIITYASYLEEVKNETNEYYRLISINKGNTDAYLNSLFSKNEILYSKLLKHVGENEIYSRSNFRTLLRDKFGTIFMIASTSSSSTTGLVMGQIVNERIRNVEQYGYEADFNFTELDMMVSNGYPSWFWEDRGAGGFAIQGGFLRIKKMFKYLGIEAWAKVFDTIRIHKIEDKIKYNLLESNLESNKSNVLSGLAKKLNLDALNQLYKSLINKGYNGIDLQLKFIETYDSFRDDATMFAHEGRHSLDRIVLKGAYQSLDFVTIEYRARLSQIAFSESPKLELANMINGIGTHGAGLSNKMIVDVLEDWIKNNKDKIKGFSSKMLAISQAYLLTNIQIRTCFINVDPFYLNKD